MIVLLIFWVGLGFLTHLLFNCFAWYRNLQTIEKTKEFDSIPCELDVKIKAALNNTSEDVEYTASDLETKYIHSITWEAKNRTVTDIEFRNVL